MGKVRGIDCNQIGEKSQTQTINYTQTKCYTQSEIYTENYTHHKFTLKLKITPNHKITSKLKIPPNQNFTQIENNT